MGNKKQENLHVRRLEAGNWYWVNRSVLHDYASRVGFAGIVVYNVLASFADSSQRCFPSQKYIAEILGCSRSTVNKAIKNLEQNGLIRKEKKDSYHCTYFLLEVGSKAEETRVSRRGNSDVRYMHTNDNKLNINNNDIDRRENWRSKNKSLKTFQPKSRKEMLALDMADVLNDHKGLALYLSFAAKYPEFFLRQVLGEVMEKPEEKIKRSRAALFNYLVRKKAEENT